MLTSFSGEPNLWAQTVFETSWAMGKYFGNPGQLVGLLPAVRGSNPSAGGGDVIHFGGLIGV